MTTSARQHAARIARTTATRTRQVTASIWRYAKAHLPKWLLGVLAACLVIPGPLDEIAVLSVLHARSSCGRGGTGWSSPGTCGRPGVWTVRCDAGPRPHPCKPKRTSPSTARP